MRNIVIQRYRAAFQQDPMLVRAPGRINLIGEHTDYNEGWVLPAAIDKYLWFAMGLSDEPDIFHVLATDAGEQLILRRQDDIAPAGSSWQDYVKAILLELNKRGYPVKAIRAVFGGDIPMGAGLSSSAALCCGLIYGISLLHDFQIKRMEIALIAQAAEHRVGLNCGLMDQYAVLFGEHDKVLCLDCKTLDFQRFPLELGVYSLVLINSNIKHELAAGSGYNDRRQSCERVVSAVRQKYPEVRSLRDVSAPVLESFRTHLSEVDYRRAAYVLAENERVLKTVEALQRNDLREVGRILYRAHEGMRTEYEITVPELDLLVDLAKAERGVAGARMVGGGFGGCTINLIETAEKEAALGRITGIYRQKTGIRPDVIEVSTGDGVQEEVVSKDNVKQSLPN